MRALSVVTILFLAAVGLLRLQSPAAFSSNSVFRVGAKASEIAGAIGAQPDYIRKALEEGDFWLKGGCGPDVLRAVSTVWIYQRPLRETVALGVDVRGIVRCVDFSWSFTTVHV